MKVEELRTIDLIRIYGSSLEWINEVKKELFERLDGKKVGLVIVTLDNFVK